jgi:hypothetical protein
VVRDHLTEGSARRMTAAGRHLKAERLGDVLCLDSFSIGRLKGVGRLRRPTACDAASYRIAEVVRGNAEPGLAAAFLVGRVLPGLSPGGPSRAGGPERSGERVAAVV